MDESVIGNPQSNRLSGFVPGRVPVRAVNGTAIVATCLSIESKFLRKPAAAGAARSAFGVRNLCRKADRMVAMAVAAAM